MKFNVLKNEILEQLKDLKKIFGIILERKLLFSYKEVDHEITLKTKKIKLSLLIFIRSEE